MGFVKEKGKKWAEVARLLKNRTDNQCMRRWKALTGWQRKAGASSSVEPPKKKKKH